MNEEVKVEVVDEKVHKKLKNKNFIIAALTNLPLIIYLIVFATIFAIDRSNSLKSYSDNKLTEEQQKLNESLEATSYANNPNAHYLEVQIGMEVQAITNIDKTSGSYVSEFVVWFDFDLDQLHHMVDTRYANLNWGAPEESVYKTYYPGNAENFNIANGHITPQYPKSYREDMIYKKVINGVETTRLYQIREMHATFRKSLESVRYPLDSMTFTINIEPTIDSDYMRYIPDPAHLDGMTPIANDFQIVQGYKLMKDNQYDIDLIYHKHSSNQSNPSIAYSTMVTSEFMITIRVNQGGPGLFVKSFLNLFAIMFWVFFGFFNSAYNNEDAMGSLNVGIFGAISSMLVGINMLDDNPNFGLIGAINLFALAIILLLTIIVMKINHTRKFGTELEKKSANHLIKLLFVTLTTVTLLTFLILPLCSYIF